MNSKIKVDVNTDEIIHGEALILTLQDQDILKGNEINEDNDILENIQIKEKDKLEFRKKQEERVRFKGKGFSDKFEDDEGQKTLLSQYDEQKISKVTNTHSKNQEGFFLDEDGNPVESKAKQLESIANKLRKHKPDLNLFFEDKVASDYLPQDDEPKGFKRRKQNKPSGQLIELESSLPLQKTATSDLLDDAQELQDSLEAKMRAKLALLKKPKKQVIDNLEQRVIERTMEEEFAKPVPKLKVLKCHQDQMKDIEEIKVLTSSTDFLKNIKTDMELQESSLRISAPTPYSIRDSRDGTTSILNVSLPTERFLNQSRIQQQQNEGMGDINNFLEEAEIQEIGKAAEEVEFLEDEKHGFGLAATLRNIRERGLLKEQKAEHVGRSKDTRRVEVDESRKEIVLEYRNDKGKIMTQREAFRYQCHIFHGKQPSRNKIEKQLRKQMYQEKVKQLAPGETPLMKALVTEQQKTNQPYMVITSKKQFNQ